MTLVPASSHAQGGPPTGAAGGVLAGQFPNPTMGTVLARAQLADAAWGVLNRAFFGPTGFATGAILTSQTLYGTLYGLRAGDVVNGFAVNINGPVAFGTVPTSLLLIIQDVTGKVLFITEEKANAVWTTAAGWRKATFSAGASFAIPTDGAYYCSIWQNGAFGTTALQTRNTGAPGSSGDLTFAGPPITITVPGLASVAVNDTPPLTATATGSRPTFPCGVAVI